jgi:hypothetical protein
MASDLTTVLTGVVGAGGVLFGVWLGGKNERQRIQIESQHERQRWHRDQLLNAYAQLVESADNFRKAATDLRNADPQDIPDLGRALEAESQLFDRAASRVSLLGSKEVQDPLNRLLVHGLRTVSNMVAGDPRAPDNEWQAELNSFFQLYDAFIAVARRDLRLDTGVPSGTKSTLIVVALVAGGAR